MSRVESLARLVLAFSEAFNRRDISGMLALVSEDCMFENAVPAPEGEVYSGKEALAQFFQAFFSEVPNARVELEEILGLGLRCVACWRYAWEDARGVKGHVRGVGIFQEKNDLIAEILCYVKG
jgi:hypothetical protein